MSTSHHSKGQSSLEFLTMFILVLLVFSAFISLFAEWQTAAVEADRERIAATIADRVGFELDRALVAGNGFSRTIELPEEIRGRNYTMQVMNGTVLLDYGPNTVRANTAVDQLAGPVKPGTNTIINDEGVINVTQP
ncbi:MAG: hypothetical protein SVW77_03355 [Candidatus Nanohaloarchaea archaeon]|nr:hypothetical protein [Candidatus Nanohaloarchaea archaeon]